MTPDNHSRAPRHQGLAATDLPVEGMLPSFDGANGWLNSQPLTPSGLRGKVVVVQFWTYTCINWLRTQAYFRAWSQRYRDQGLVTIGVHTPEFKFEHDLDNVRWAVDARRIDYPVAIDNEFAVWRAFANHYWPALYFVDAEGRIRHHRFGEGDYERSEMVIRQLLAEAGLEDLRPGLATVSRTATRCRPIGRTSGRRKATSAMTRPPGWIRVAAARRGIGLTPMQRRRPCGSTTGGLLVTGPSAPTRVRSTAPAAASRTSSTRAT